MPASTSVRTKVSVSKGMLVLRLRKGLRSAGETSMAVGAGVLISGAGAGAADVDASGVEDAEFNVAGEASLAVADFVGSIATAETESSARPLPFTSAERAVEGGAVEAALSGRT
jgi:hypothetical protein